MKTLTLTKEYIESVAKSLIHATPQEVLDFKALMEIHPQGEELVAALNEVGPRLIVEALLEALFADVEEAVCEEAKQEPTPNASSVSQFTAQELSNFISQQAPKAKIEPVFIPYIKPEPQVDISASIKEQVAYKNLVEGIKAQAESKPAFDLSASIKGQVVEQQAAKTNEEKIKGILNEIVEEIINEDAASEIISLDPNTIKLYEVAFSTVFFTKANVLGFAEPVEYAHEYTAYILSSLASYLVEEEGFELAFNVVEGKVVAGLV
ncbi:hypothetical protein P4493_10455 [Bacillus thuringiensis]|uniref:Uncharacterized protein n=5 Tax=Bacillus thuringiensis TaxID=1428 RepID=A0AB35PAK9_BACTU|nr:MULTISPECIES: hypothetical protein [Bacillus]EAO56655.1 hypothetical protein RBTH_07333 [Bacillus thuringiensis serovar israelensis ATCC 35646]MEC3433761.1 hypothetical protein [Bacillus cereus]AFQ30315.1 hypothetical protein BTF1_31072 [Bacillus thuringiensis HD-789]AJH02518.1 hypothetical protein AS86_6557 [Bacillus thuringiensis HD1002]AND28506.1 hypothetical protein ATN07_32785 [Bacillus thuringiensis serovar israelensis]